MSKRLQVLFDEAELEQLRETARRHGMPVSEWVRQTLRAARRQDPHADVEAKVRALRVAVRHEFPTADVDQIPAEIEHGYAAD
jgi:DhnA family fructose-bisphosphate aldolase class Ia